MRTIRVLVPIFLVARRLHYFDARPIRIQLVRHELREPGQRALAHLRPGDPHGGAVILSDDNPDPDRMPSIARRKARQDGSPWR